jgi:hypothetical protein
VEQTALIIHIKTGFFQTVPHLLIFKKDGLLLEKLSEARCQELLVCKDRFSTICKTLSLQTGGTKETFSPETLIPIMEISSVRVLFTELYGGKHGWAQLDVRTSGARYFGSIDRAFDPSVIASSLRRILGQKAK